VARVEFTGRATRERAVPHETENVSAPPAPRFATHFVESVLLTWMGSFARIVIGIVALRLVTGAIPEDALGAYWILTSMAALLANLADFGLGLGAVRHLPLTTDKNARRALMQTVLLLRVFFLALLCGLIYFCKPLVVRLFGADAIGPMYPYLYAFVVLNSLGELYNNFMQGQNRFRMIAVLAFVSSCGRLVLILAFVRGLGLGVPGLFMAESAAMLVTMALSAAFSGQGWRLRLDRPQGRHLLHFGFPLYLNTLLSYTANRINTVMVGSMSTTTAVSYFSVAGRIPDQMQFILRAYVFVYLPNMSHLLANPDDRQARRLLAASLRLMSFVFAMLGLALSLFRHEMLSVLAPASYQVAAPAVPLLLGGLCFAALGQIMGTTFVALGDTRTPVLINIWTSLLSLGLNLMCIHYWGFMGAAWANLVFNVLAYAITDVVLSRRIRPDGRGYLGILLFLIGLLLAAMRAGVVVRILALAVGGGGSLVLSSALRNDLVQVWNARFRNRLPFMRRPA
jgi:lipopolysaccharide exporter